MLIASSSHFSTLPQAMWSLKAIATAACLASLTIAAPHPFDGPDHEIEVFKRDEPFTPDDFVLAEMHGVNTTEMFKHSVIRRRGEEDITLWVHHDFVEAIGPAIDPAIKERAVDQVDGDFHDTNDWHMDICRSREMHGDTGPNAPCTGGLKEIQSWAARNTGHFRFQLAGNPWRTLVAAGSNSDCNGRFRAQKKYSGINTENLIGIGNVNIYDLVGKTMSRYTQTYDGRDRARAYGELECGAFFTPMNWQVRRWPHPV
jgi:hypothetical protein